MIEKPNKIGGKMVRDKEGKFVEGHPNLGAGRPEGSISLTEAIKRQLKELSPDQKRTALDWLADNIIQDALENNNTMRKLIWNYVDGMPKQSIDLGGGEIPVKLIIEDGGNREKNQAV